jgi:hypothetical protein
LHQLEDFQGPLVDSNRAIKGFGGTTTAKVKIGTITWKWLDNQGKTHTFLIPKLFYVPDGNVRLLSPQHWAQTQKVKDTTKHGTGSGTVNNKVVLFWNNCKNKLAIPLGKTAPGYRKFAAFCTTAELDYDREQINPIIAFLAHAVSDDEDEAESTIVGSIDSPSTDPERETGANQLAPHSTT